MTRSRYRFGEDHYPHFMTATVVAWLPVFSYPCFADVILNSWRFLQTQREIKLLAIVILENHLHWIAVGPDLAKRVGELKSFTATSILREMQQRQYQTLLQELTYYKLRQKVDPTHQLWQEGSHPQIIETEAVMWQKLEYIHNNPLRRGSASPTIQSPFASLHRAGEGGRASKTVRAQGGAWVREQ
ncbi:MAG: transposase [Planctomycetota bacterium]|nr:transposase [Planctomycetota bacterium]